jgi:hypothetical protein
MPATLTRIVWTVVWLLIGVSSFPTNDQTNDS